MFLYLLFFCLFVRLPNGRTRLSQTKNSNTSHFVSTIYKHYSEVAQTSVNQNKNSLCCTLRSGHHKISTMIRTFQHGLEKNHACKWTFDNFPGMLTYKLVLENCQKTICRHGYNQWSSFCVTPGTFAL